MKEPFSYYEPIVPEETKWVFGTKAKSWKWSPYPSRRYWESTDATEEVSELDRADEVLELMGSGLGGAIDAVDLTVGCKFPCQTCLRDSQRLSSTMALETASRIVNSHLFDPVANKYSLCIGFAAEPSDNDNFTEIVSLFLEATASKPNFNLRVTTNFRDNKSDVFRDLLAIASKNDHLQVNFSLPRNDHDTVQKSFEQFRDHNSQLFGENIHVFDLANPTWQEVEYLGRVLPNAPQPLMPEVESFQILGPSGIILNPEGLWLAVNCTRYNAHTPEIFTPIHSGNARLIADNISRTNPPIKKDFSSAKLEMKIAQETEIPFQPRVASV